MDFKEFRRIRRTYLNENRDTCKKWYKVYKGQTYKYAEDLKQKEKEMIGTGPNLIVYDEVCNWHNLATKSSEPTPPPVSWQEMYIQKEEGNTPMSYGCKATTAFSAPSIAINAPAEVTDLSKQRDYLLGRLQDMYQSKNFRKMFNLDADNAPCTYEELIEKITKKQFKIDKKIETALKEAKESGEEIRSSYGECYLPSYGYYINNLTGIIWDGPQPDTKGYDLAVKEFKAAYNAAKDIIWVKSPEDGLDALRQFSEWEPSNAPKQ